MNPFILAGLVLAAIGLLQEAKEGEDKPVKLIQGPPGKPGKDGKTVVVEKKIEKPKQKAIVEKPTDG